MYIIVIFILSSSINVSNDIWVRKLKKRTYFQFSISGETQLEQTRSIVKTVCVPEQHRTLSLHGLRSENA